MSYAVMEQEVHRGLHLVPAHLQEGLQEHCLTGRPVGYFLDACLSNNLRDAVAYGDDQSLAGIKGIIQFLHNYAPSQCWGSAEKAQAWRDKRGLLQLLEAEQA